MKYSNLVADYQTSLSDLIDEMSSEVEYLFAGNGFNSQEFSQLYYDYAQRSALIANDFFEKSMEFYGKSGYELYEANPIDALWKQMSGYMNSDYEDIHIGARKKDVDDFFEYLNESGIFKSIKDADDKEAAVLELLHSGITRSARETLLGNTKLNKIRYARVPIGKTCAFCIMICGRGFVYLSAETAGISAAYHDNCDCQIMPNIGNGAKDISNNARMYEEMYKSAYKKAQEQGKLWFVPETVARANRTLAARKGYGIAEKKLIDHNTRVITKIIRDDNPAFSKDMDTKGQFINSGGDYLEPHERAFVNRMVKNGESLEWISKSTEQKPTNDFIWNDEEWELKNTSPDYYGIRGRIMKTVYKALKSNFTKDRFIIDIGENRITNELLKEVANYNLNTPDYSVKEIKIFGNGEMKDVEIKNKANSSPA
jgi:hypothetical protein